MKNLIIGLGTGRCGTHSLSDLLNTQNNVISFHEPLKDVPQWNYNKKAAEKIIKNIDGYFKQSNNVSVVAFNYLPYVEDILKAYPNAKFICLKREKNATIKSYVKWAGKGNRNFWQNHGGNKWNLCVWDKCYPKYDNIKIDEAVGMYWDEYYNTCDLLSENHPNFNVFSTKALNTSEGVSAILDACGIKDKKIITKIKKSVQKY